MPGSLPRLVRRGDVFYFRMAVPRRLVVQLGTREIKVSLKTSDRALANLRCRSLSNRFDLAFRGLTGMPDLTFGDVDQEARRFFQACLNASLERAYYLPTDPAVNVPDEVAYLKDRINGLRQQLSSRQFGAGVREDAQSILDPLTAVGGAIDLELVQHAQTVAARAAIEDARILAAHLEGRPDRTAPLDPLFLGLKPTGLPPLGEMAGAKHPVAFSVAAAGEQFVKFKSGNDWNNKTSNDVRRVLRLVEEAIGGERPVSSVSTPDVKAMRDLLLELPPNYMKLKENKGLSARDAAQANSGKESNLSLKTKDKYFSMFRGFLRWCMDEGHLDKMPGPGVKIPGVSKIASNRGRAPYSDAQLEAIFSSPLYAGHHSPGRRSAPGSVVTRDGKFWIPLISLFSGMRLGEIVQLLVSDIKTEAGVTYFDIDREEGDDKTIKTASSRRRVPVHSNLIALGFGRYLEARQGGASRLFPEIGKGADGYYSHNFSKWWGRYTRETKIRAPKTAFHSFRHNFKDALQAAEVPEALA
ncbi:MAG: hypothetical protein JWR08_1792, partial [Enterovirga sp.]|nr:hypothetical protein [Enterovirga sp.]